MLAGIPETYVPTYTAPTDSHPMNTEHLRRRGASEHFRMFKLAALGHERHFVWIGPRREKCEVQPAETSEPLPPQSGTQVFNASFEGQFSHEFDFPEFQNIATILVFETQH